MSLLKSFSLSGETTKCVTSCTSRWTNFKNLSNPSAHRGFSTNSLHWTKSKASIPSLWDGQESGGTGAESITKAKWRFARTASYEHRSQFVFPMGQPMTHSSSPMAEGFTHGPSITSVLATQTSNSAEGVCGEQRLSVVNGRGSKASHKWTQVVMSPSKKTALFDATHQKAWGLPCGWIGKLFSNSCRSVPRYIIII